MKRIKAILTITIAGLLLCSTLGFAVSRHYCMGMLVEESFYHISDDCGEDTDDHCPGDEGHLKMNCCADENIVLGGVEVLTASKEQLKLTLEFSSAFFLTNPLLALTAPTHKLPTIFPPAPPELSGKDILVRDQRFLI